MASTNARRKNTDARGRITPGESFANRTMIIEKRGDELVLRIARVIPEREAWLYDNEQALAAVWRGLGQAKTRKLAKKGPELGVAKELADQLRDD